MPLQVPRYVLHPISASLGTLLCCHSAGNVLRCDVVGRILMKCFLSDMPELRLGLNEKLEDITFHQCVNLATYETQKVVTFIPPDGEFELMRWGDGQALSFGSAQQAYAVCVSPYPGSLQCTQHLYMAHSGCG